jgi:hypothetical protein
MISMHAFATIGTHRPRARQIAARPRMVAMHLPH